MIFYDRIFPQLLAPEYK